MGHKGVSKRKPKQNKAEQAPGSVTGSGRGVSKDILPAQAVEKNKVDPTPGSGSKPPSGSGKKPRKR